MDTKNQILDAAERLIQAKGFSGFSFQDVADEVGIKKASIYYYHPAKGDLGRAVVARYRQRMSVNFEKLAQVPEAELWSLFDSYLGPIRDFGRATGLACLSGVMGGEYLNLPKEMQVELEAFLVEHENFLTQLLDRGRDSKQFSFEGEARTVARLVFSAIEGALLIKRIKADPGYVESVLAFVATLLGRPH